jgi:lipoate-protein ligase A
MLFFSPAAACFNLIAIESGFNTGPYHMALDDSLLEYLRNRPQSGFFLIRTYLWETPTISLGTHQSNRDVQFLRQSLSEPGTSSGFKTGTIRWVRRPTGGRAIVHGKDISYSFVTNIPAFYDASVRDCYGFLNQILQTAVKTLGIQTQRTAERDEKAYMRSPICFETHTPFDLMNPSGQKIGGSAQRRKDGAILQQGTLFVETDPKALYPRFHQALTDAATDILQNPHLSPDDRILADPEFQSLFQNRLGHYIHESLGIVDNV